MAVSFSLFILALQKNSTLISMKESEPEIIKFNNSSSHYQFFRFVMEALDVIFFSQDENPPIIDPTTETDFDWLTHEQLVYKFPGRAIAENYTALTLQEFVTLMFIVDKVSKILLTDLGEELRIRMIKIQPDLVDDWDKDFLKSAQVIFETFSTMFKDLPEYNQLLKMATGS
jgi:hypothetical protein